MSKSMYDQAYGVFTYDVGEHVKVVPFLVSAFDDEQTAVEQQQISEYVHGQQRFVRRMNVEG